MASTINSSMRWGYASSPAAPKRFIPGLLTDLPVMRAGESPDSVRKLIASGEISVLDPAGSDRRGGLELGYRFFARGRHREYIALHGRGRVKPQVDVTCGAGRHLTELASPGIGAGLRACDATGVE